MEAAARGANQSGGGGKDMLAREERPDLAARGEWAEAAEDEEGTKRGWGRARAGAMERDGADE
eukprot:scaffold229493_cov26-Tisochrysis_lutea.AAC.2